MNRAIMLMLALSIPVARAQAPVPPTSQPASQPASAPASQPMTHDHDHVHAEGPQDTIFTCSMHPQIVESAPGACPICGMDLVPKKVPAKEAPPRAAASEARKIAYWVAPMDPSDRRDGPGKSATGMDLVPVYEGGDGPLVTVDPVVVQNMGVRIARVNRGSLSREIRTIGSVRVAETRESVVNLRYSGWIERLIVNETGALVKKGDALFEVYSPELVSAEQEYQIALRTGGAGTPLAQSAARRLELFGVPRSVVRDVAKNGARGRLTVRAPRAGYVTHLNVVEGARVAAGADLYRIADLDEVWVEAEVYEADSPWVAVGAPATVELSFQSAEPRAAQIDYIYPTLNPKTRTMRVRLVLPNPDLGLKPGAFATVDITAQQRADVLLVPTEAIIHSGVRQVVFVALAEGHFEPREIQPGLTGNAYLTEVRAGLAEGERVVTSGQFLLDSESQLQEAVQKMLADRLAAASAFAPMEAAAGAAPAASATYWTCSMHPQVVQDAPGTCPICGMDLVEKKR